MAENPTPDPGQPISRKLARGAVDPAPANTGNGMVIDPQHIPPAPAPAPIQPMHDPNEAPDLDRDGVADAVSGVVMHPDGSQNRLYGGQEVKLADGTCIRLHGEVTKRPPPPPPPSVDQALDNHPLVHALRQQYEAEISDLKNRGRRALDAERKRRETVESDRGILSATVDGLKSDLDTAKRKLGSWWQRFKHWVAGISTATVCYAIMALHYGSVWWWTDYSVPQHPPAPVVQPVDTSNLRAAQRACLPYLPGRSGGPAEQLDAAIDALESVK